MAANILYFSRGISKTSQLLAEFKIKTFKDANYRTVVTNEEVKVYRVFGFHSEAGGRFVTASSAGSRIEAKIDSALKPEWGNSYMYEAEIAIPKGTELNIGKVAPQEIIGTKTILEGGADQIYLPEDWPLEWITNVRIVPSV